MMMRFRAPIDLRNGSASRGLGFAKMRAYQNTGAAAVAASSRLILARSWPALCAARGDQLRKGGSMRIKAIVIAFAIAVGIGVGAGAAVAPTSVQAADDCNGCRK
jgi:hypothetical protein